MRLSSFNLLHGRSLTDGLVDPARLAAAVRGLDADVVALQEVDRDQERSGTHDLTALAAEAMGAVDHRFVPTLIGTPGFSWRAPSAPEQNAADDGAPAYGVALVSRIPVERWLPLDLGASPARLPLLIDGRRKRVLFVRDEPRAAVAAVLAPGAPVRTVVATHLSFAPGFNVAQLRRLSRAVRGLPGPLVLLGDLNLPGWAVRGVPGWRPLARLATYPTDEPRVQLDHALVRVADGRALTVRAAEALRTPISDHRALIVDLEV